MVPGGGPGAECLPSFNAFHVLFKINKVKWERTKCVCPHDKETETLPILSKITPTRSLITNQIASDVIRLVNVFFLSLPGRWHLNWVAACSKFNLSDINNVMLIPPSRWLVPWFVVTEQRNWGSSCFASITAPRGAGPAADSMMQRSLCSLSCLEMSWDEAISHRESAARLRA